MEEDYGSPFDKILSYAGGAGSGGESGRTQIFVCPSDPDPHGSGILDAGGDCLLGGETPPGPLSSFVINAYYLFGATLSRIELPAQSIYVAERRSEGKPTDFCDIHYHPWLGETELPDNSNGLSNPTAIASRRHSQGSNCIYSDGHAKRRRFESTRQPFEGHELYGEHQAF